MSAKASSQTQSIDHCRPAAATSLIAGNACTTSPSEDVLITRRRRRADIQCGFGLLRQMTPDSSPDSTQMRTPMSLVIITRNAGAQLGAALDSARFADEVVVVDSGSDDDTVQIAASF